MCGIVGAFSPSLSGDARAERVRAGVATLRHRGPDAIGVWSNGHATLGHTRLSVIDLSANANQPMQWRDLPVGLVYNGETYNYLELRTQLHDAGFVFSTNSDTEVVLASYIAWGAEAFVRLKGMFSLALWDGRTSSLHLVRDRFGIKPLYFRDCPQGFFFASEPKALLAMLPKESRDLDYQAFHEFMWYGNPIGERTLFRDVYKLAPGECITRRASHHHSFPIWKVESVPQVADAYQIAVGTVQERLRKAVHSHLVADVPVGVFLSGGIDSSAITAFASERLGSSLRTYSVAFDFEQTNELPYARAVASNFGTQHEELYVSAPDISDLMPQLIRCHDEPFADAANIPLFLLSKAVSGHAKVVLQGDGGDEVFGGYARYEWLRTPSALWRLARALTRALVPQSTRLPANAARLLRVVEALGAPPHLRAAFLLTIETERTSPTYALGAEVRSRLLTTDPFKVYRKIYDTTLDLDPVQAMLRTDLRILLPCTFLEKVDKTTMAHGVEARVPFLDGQLAEYAIGLPAGYKVRLGNRKRILREALKGILPDDILRRPKTGFGVPYSHWLRGPLRQFLLDTILQSNAKRDGAIDATRVELLAREHESGSYDHGFILWKLLNLALWYQLYQVTL